jgi:hypothetical protein
VPQPVDVGSVLGGRYKVTAYVLASADRDLVLDGVDQVLNRPVSILVSSPGNAGQVAASAREVAMGDRAGNIQVLDLGTADEQTYLVTNRASAADLLDLIVQQDAPYIEPFYTDTLGSEIFGVPRSTEPENYDDEEDDDFEEQGGRGPVLPNVPKPRLPRFGKREPGPSGSAGDGAAGAAGAGAAGAAGAQHSSGPDTAEQAIAPGTVPLPPVPGAQPRISAERPNTAERAGQAHVASRGSSPEESPAPAGARGPDSHAHQGRPASRFPAAVASAGAGQDYAAYDDYEEDEDPRRKRLLVGVVLGLVVVGALVLAATQLGSLFRSDPVAGPPAATEPAEGEGTPDPTDTAGSNPDAAAPEAVSVTRLVPDNPEMDAENDGSLPQMLDDNPASFWSSYVYANETFGGLAESLALVVELQEESTVSEVQIAQLNGSGGNFTVLLNDKPTIAGADQVAQSGFTGPTVTIPTTSDDGSEPTARYVIINITQLPRLSNIDAPYPWGIRIAEINIS